MPPSPGAGEGGGEGRAITLAFFLLLSACSPAPEENCLLHSKTALTDGEAAQRVDAGFVLTSSSIECELGLCVRDQTVTPGPPASQPLGYCPAPCEPACPEGTACTQLDAARVCLRTR